MKWKRNFIFSKRNIYKQATDGEIIYSTAKNEILTLKALEKAKKYDCSVTNFKINGDVCEITIWGTQDCFLGFVNDYINEFNGYIENVAF